MGDVQKSALQKFDVIVVGAGPAGSSCARFLSDAGKRVALIDRAEFPRVKLCAGWLSRPVWKALGIDPSEYDRGLWHWNRCHVHFGGRCHKVEVDGYFIRRYEFDDYLVRRCGAALIRENVKEIEHDGSSGWIINRTSARAISAPILIGAAGTHCPIARHLFGRRPNRPAGARELEFEAEPQAIAETRVGRDGEPELYLHPDLRGYSWNIPKGGWLNVGTGTIEAKQVHAATDDARELFTKAGHLPLSAQDSLDHMKGHSYYLFEPSHLEFAQEGSALLIGDSLGLAHPLTAEGIYPAILSARLAADSIIGGDIAGYTARMKRHALFSEYSTLWQLRDSGGAFRSSDSSPATAPKREGRSQVEAAGDWLVARGFAWMFAGRPVPGHRILGPVIRTARRWDRLVSPNALARRNNPRRRS